MGNVRLNRRVRAVGDEDGKSGRRDRSPMGGTKAARDTGREAGMAAWKGTEEGTKSKGDGIEGANP